MVSVIAFTIVGIFIVATGPCPVRGRQTGHGPVLLNLCFFVRRDDFSCRLRELVQLFDTGFGCRQNGDKDSPSSLGDLITVGTWHFVNNSMGPQHSELAAGGSRTPAALGWQLSLRTIEKLLKIAVAEAVNQKLTVIDGDEQFLILGPGP
jgi:hypothetical protein